MSKVIALATCLFLSASATATEIALENPDFETPMVGDRIPGWSRTQHAGVRAYEISNDTDSHAKGKSSIRMLRTTKQAYGLISQQLESPDFAGKQIELTAALKGEDVGKKGWVMVLTFKNFSNILDQVRAAPVVGDSDWKDFTIKKVAPPGTNQIEIGFMLLDGGTGWADNVRLRTHADEKPAAEASVHEKAAGENLPVKKPESVKPARNVEAVETSTPGNGDQSNPA